MKRCLYSKRATGPLFVFIALFSSSNLLAFSCENALAAADPARRLSEQNIPDPHYNLRPDGEIWITGTGTLYLVYENYRKYAAGETPEVRNFRLFHRFGDTEVALNDVNGEVPWGIVVQSWRDPHGQGPHLDVLYAGVMVPEPGKSNARGPDDNQTRRIVAFTKNEKGNWISRGPCFGAERGWKNHAYDIDFFTDRDGATWAYYAKVDEVRDRRPVRTQIYARRMLPPRNPGDPPPFGDDEVRIVSVGAGQGQKPFPSAVRACADPGGPIVSLVEGPRVREIFIPLSRVHAPLEKNPDGSLETLLRLNGYFHRAKIENGHVRLLLMGFSANDFELPTYTTHFAVGFSPTDFVPLLTADRSDLKNFNALLGLNANSRTAVGRPNPISHGNETELLFHASSARPGEVPNLNELRRSPYRVPLEIAIAPDGSPKGTDLLFGCLRTRQVSKHF